MSAKVMVQLTRQSFKQIGSGHLLFLVSSSSMGGSIMSDKSREPGLGMVLAAK